MVLRDARLSVAHTGDCRAVLGTFVDGKLTLPLPLITLPLPLITLTLPLPLPLPYP